MNSIFLILTFGPSDMWNVRCTSFGPPGIVTISGVTSALWKPLSFIMSRTMPDTFRTSAGSMKVSRRISDIDIFSASSIFDVSTAFDPT